MQGQFTLKITLGNDACRKRTDVASILRETAVAILQKRVDPSCGKILDRNGNTVGEWSF